MTDALCELLYAPLLVVDIVLIVTTLIRWRENRTVRRSVGLYISLACRVIAEIVFFAASSADVALHAYKIALIFRAFSAVFMLLMVAGFYRIDRAAPKWVAGLLFVPAVAWTVILAAPSGQRLVFKELAVLSTDPVTQLQMVPTLYYSLQTIYDQLLVVSVILILIITFRKLPRGYRNGAQFLFVGFSAYLVCTVLEFWLLRDLPISFSLIGANIYGVMFYFTTLVSGRHDFLHIGRREVFHYLDEGVLILDDKGIILDANLTAQRLFHLGEIKDQQVVFDDLLDEMVRSGRATRRQPDEEPGEMLYFLDHRIPLFYEMQRQPVSGRNVNEGKCVILTDRTNSQLYMERLLETAGEDALTGLPNRYRYQELLRELDGPDCLPLSIIAADVNGLKQVNDTQGHYIGDELLKNTAALLQQCCPPDGYVARIGGDEFVMLLPRCPHIAAEALITQIGRSAARFEKRPRPSLALGSATKADATQNINQMIDEADRRMYDDKRERRR